MKKIKVSEATGVVLDYLVARAEGLDVVIDPVEDQVSRFKATLALDGVIYPDDVIETVVSNMKPILRIKGSYGINLETVPKYSTDWAQGGPVIQTERIDILNRLHKPWLCEAEVLVAPATRVKGRGPTPLIAAMRCYVISKLGEEVEVPDALT